MEKDFIEQTTEERLIYLEGVLAYYARGDQFASVETMKELEQRVRAIRSRLGDDRLAVMFRMQEEFQQSLDGKVVNDLIEPFEWRRIKFDQLAFSQEERRYLTRWVQYWCDCIIREAAECIDWLPWKTWSRKRGNKSDSPETWSKAHIREMRMEGVDKWHFLMNLMLVLGVGANEFYQLYCEKHNINYERQDTGTY